MRNLEIKIPHTTEYGHPMKASIKEIWKFGLMWQTKYASAAPKKLRVGVDFRPCSEGNFHIGHLYVVQAPNQGQGDPVLFLFDHFNIFIQSQNFLDQ